MLKGKHVYLRPLKKEDTTTLLLWENDIQNWRYSATEAPYSIQEIDDYIATASRVRDNRQLRLMICLNANGEPIGSVDLFAIDFRNERSGVGILIAKEKNRGRGFAKEALLLLEEYTISQLNLKQLYCNIQEDNVESISLFEKLDYQQTGKKKSWVKLDRNWIDVYFYQKIF